jgi:16S rRNA (uracil1498-N3)-methyltransferase
MAVPRLHVPGELAAGRLLSLSPEQAHYLGTVMRLAAGDRVSLFNGRDGEWCARIEEIRREKARVTAETQTRPQVPEPDLWLAFAPLKRDATDLVVQKATELGVSALLPVFTARTNAARINADRLGAIAREAAEQSERLTVPELRSPVPLYDLLASWPEGRSLAAAIERGEPSPLPPAGALLVGPEGGFAPAELDVLRAARFVSVISLGPRILRAETAAIAGLALLQGAGWSTTSKRP